MVNYLNWVDIVSDDDQSGLLLLDEAHHGVDTRSDHRWSRRWLVSLALSSSGRTGNQSLLTVLLGLWSVAIEQLEQLAG